MALVTITGDTIRDGSGRKDNRPWYFTPEGYQNGNPGVITPRRSKPLIPSNGVLTAELEGGISGYIENPDRQRWLVTIPLVDSPLWDVIEDGVAYPPNTSQALLAAAVVKYILDNADTLAFDDFNLDGTELVFSRQGEEVGRTDLDPLTFKGTIDGVSDAEDVGKAVVRASTKPDAWDALSVPVARPKILPTTTFLSRQFDRRLSLYNAHAGNRKIAKAGLARSQTLPRLTRIACKGDSITQGVSYSTHRQADSFPRQLREKLKALGYRCAGDGFVVPNGFVPGMTDARWAYTGTWNYEYTSSNYLWGVRTSTAGATVTFTTSEPCTRIAIHWFNGIGADANVTIDGVSVTALDVVSGNTVGVQEYTGLADTRHTVVITTTGSFALHGIDCTSSTGDAAGFVIDNYGRSGASTINWLPSDSEPYPTWRNHDALAKRLQVSTNNQLNVTVLQLGTNDAYRDLPPTSNGTIPADFKTNLATIIESSMAVSEVMLIAPYQVGNYRDDAAGMAPYNEAVYQLADEYDLPVLDMADRWQSYSAAFNTLGFISSDQLHPSPEGYFDYAEAVTGLLGAQVAKGPDAPTAAETHTDLIGWTYDPATQTSGSIIPAAATIYFCKIPLRTRRTITNIVLHLNTLGVNLTNAFVALYKSDGTIVRQSADQSTAWGAGGSTGLKTIPLTAPASVAPTGPNDFVWAAIYVGSGNTLPTFARGVGAGSAFINAGTTASRRRFGSLAQASIATLPNVTPSAMGLASNAYWMALS